MNQTDATPPSLNVGKVLLINPLELTSIQALVAYAAYEKKVSEDKIRQVLLSHFGVEDVKNLPHEAYDTVIRFLVDLHDDVIFN